MTRHLLLCLAGLLALPAAAAALPASSRLYQAKYGYRPSCDACHVDGGGSRMNPYGEAFAKAGHNAAAFAAVEGADSDGDGAANGAEIAAKANPGQPKSTPDAPGDWLAGAEGPAIPLKELGALYGPVDDYKAMEGKLSPEQVAKAAAMGAPLTEDDAVPTFYFPVRGGKKEGVAQLMTVEHGGERVNVGVAVGKDGAILKVAPLGEAGKGLAVYDSLVGVKEIKPVADASTLEGKVAEAVNRALATIHVVFKKD